jgi:hypothetical protein
MTCFLSVSVVNTVKMKKATATLCLSEHGRRIKPDEEM